MERKLQNIFARNVRERRKRLGLTQAQLAEMIDVSTTFLTELETCRKMPSFLTIERLAAALGVHPWMLLFEYGGEQSSNTTVVTEFAAKLKVSFNNTIDTLLKETEQRVEL